MAKATNFEPSLPSRTSLPCELAQSIIIWGLLVWDNHSASWSSPVVYDVIEHFVLPCRCTNIFWWWLVHLSTFSEFKSTVRCLISWNPHATMSCKISRCQPDGKAWGIVKRRLRRHCSSNVDKLEQAISDVWVSVTPNDWVPVIADTDCDRVYESRMCSKQNININVLLSLVAFNLGRKMFYY